MTAPSAAAGAGCPDRLIHALHRALFLALVPKRDGSRHHRSCLNRTVNASSTACSDACLYVNGACLLAEDWASEQEAEAPRQLRLEAS